MMCPLDECTVAICSSIWKSRFLFCLFVVEFSFSRSHKNTTDSSVLLREGVLAVIIPTIFLYAMRLYVHLCVCILLWFILLSSHRSQSEQILFLICEWANINFSRSDKINVTQLIKSNMCSYIFTSELCSTNNNETVLCCPKKKWLTWLK